MIIVYVYYSCLKTRERMYSKHLLFQPNDEQVSLLLVAKYWYRPLVLL